jgi:hypothetical protein
VLPLAKGLLETERLAVDMPMSARLLPDDDRWKFGCCGRPIAGFTEVDRECCAVYGALRRSVLELERLTAEAG